MQSSIKTLQLDKKLDKWRQQQGILQLVLFERRKVGSCVSQGLVLGTMSMFISVLRTRIRCALIKFMGDTKLGGFNIVEKDSLIT